MAWTTEYSLKWDGVGLDSEPDARLYLRIMDNARGLVPMLLPRLWDHERPRRAQAAYATLVDRIRADGYSVTHDQFPLIADERWAGSTLLRRLLGLVDVMTDCEVWMLYTSVFPVVGPGILWIYPPKAQAVGVGSTGSGPDIPDLRLRRCVQPALSDLRRMPLALILVTRDSVRAPGCRRPSSPVRSRPTRADHRHLLAGGCPFVLPGMDRSGRPCHRRSYDPDGPPSTRRAVQATTFGN